LSIQNRIIFFAAFKGTLYECVQLDQRLTRNNQLFGSSLTKKFFPRILIIHGMTSEFKISRRIQIYIKK
jgi:hypothetical protein